MREREYWRFCLEHVREYNQSYNYFAGMSDDAVARYQKDAVTGHRPTWKMGLNGGADECFAARARDRSVRGDARVRRRPRARARANARARRRGRCTTPSARRSTRSGSKSTPTAVEIKARFKELVKRHHPDANGGDRSTEDRLRRDHPGVQLPEVGEVLLTSCSGDAGASSRSRSAQPESY